MHLSDSQVKRLDIPDWMIVSEKTQRIKAGNSHTGFLRRTLKEISKVLQNDVLAERFAGKNGLFQRIDPRVKLLSVLLFMIFTGTAKSFLTLVVLLVISLVIVRLSRLEMVSYVKRVWLILPLIMFVLSIPASTSLIIQGTPLIYLYRGVELKIWFIRLPEELYVSLEGVKVILKMSLRTGISISYAYILVMTTRWSHLAKSLAVLRVPKLIITIIDMTYRYIFVLSKLSIEIFEARNLRTVGKIRNRDNRRFISNSIALLFVKANYISEEIYDSMVCRGYAGEPVSLKEFKLTGSDFVWIFNMAVIVIILAVL